MKYGCDYMNFLNNLEYLLKENNMSRAELARSIGIAPSTINSWFNRSCDGVSLKTLRDIANFFNVSIETLVNSNNIQSIYFTDKDFTKEELQIISRFSRFLKENRKDE